MLKSTASVIVCTYTAERWPLLQLAVASLLGQREGVSEVVVVVDHDLALLERARREWGDRVRVIANEFDPGLSGARNSGVAVATSDVVAFIDDDAEAQDGWIEGLLSAYDAERVVACGGAVVAKTDGPAPAWWPPEFDWVVGCSYVGMPIRRAFVRNLLGANMSFRRENVLAAGGFADGVGRRGADAFGCEETDLCIRLTKANPSASIVYEPTSLVHHAVPGDRLSWRYFRTRCYAEGISKARVAQRVGANRALSAERAYTTRVLPLGIIRSMHFGAGGARRAGAIVAGLALTTAGYVRGRITLQPAPGVAC